MYDLFLNNDKLIPLNDGDLTTVSNKSNDVFTGELDKQKLTIGLNINQGDWFLNINYGIPYSQQLGTIPQRLFQNELVSFIYNAFYFVQDVSKITIQNSNSTYLMNFSALVDNDVLLNIQLNQSI